MTPAEAIDQFRRMLAEVGETIQVRRYSGLGAARTYVDTPTLARVIGYQPKDLVGAIVQGDVRVITDPAPLAAMLPLTVDDKLVIRGVEHAIKGIDDNTRRIQGVLVGLDIQAAG